MLKFYTVCFLIWNFSLFAAGCSNEGTEGIQPETHRHPKKGACIATKNEGWHQKVDRLNVSWHYTWNNLLMPEEPAGVEFVPMIWSAKSDTASVRKKLAEVSRLKSEGKVKYLLGFNEPDGAEQANMTVQGALAYWPMLEEMDLPLGSPACVHPDGEWMQQFMKEAMSRNYRVDFVCVHWYGGISVSAFVDRLKKVYALYGKPLWITEFAPADWQAASPAESRISKAQVMTFMQEVLPALDNLGFVERYAWFSASETSGPLGNAALFNSSGNLTPLGKYYSDYQGAQK